MGVWPQGMGTSLREMDVRLRGIRIRPSDRGVLKAPMSLAKRETFSFVEMGNGHGIVGNGHGIVGFGIVLG